MVGKVQYRSIIQSADFVNNKKIIVLLIFGGEKDRLPQRSLQGPVEDIKDPWPNCNLQNQASEKTIQIYNNLKLDLDI